MEFTTLCYLERDDHYLMLHRRKKEHDFNKDMWIGVGGHFEENESPDECLLREVKEETGLTLTSCKMRGILTFVYRDICEYVCLYTADGFEGEMTSCNEGELKWVPKDKLLTLNLFEGDLIFFKLLLEDAPFFSLKLTYDQVNEHRLIDANLNGKKLELFDILDENGVPTGLTRERSLCHLLDTPRTELVMCGLCVLLRQRMESLLTHKPALHKISLPMNCFSKSEAMTRILSRTAMTSRLPVMFQQEALSLILRFVNSQKNLESRLHLAILFLLAHMKETATASFMENHFTTMNLVHCISTQNLCRSKILCCRSQKSSQ